MRRAVQQKVVIVGSGRLAWHLAKRLAKRKSFSITVYNRRMSERLRLFRSGLKCRIKSSLDNIESRADYYVLCVKDEAIYEISKKINPLHPSSVVLHVSGSRRLSEINSSLINRGVLYPVQTFSFQDEVRWDETPLLTEGNNKHSFVKINELAAALGGQVYPASTSERLRIHLAAVLANNFTNSLYVCAEKVLKGGGEAQGFDLKILLPLIEQGVKKLRRMSPSDAQTGPARRGDKRVIRQHLQLLKDDEKLQEIYRLMSALIAGQQKAKPL